MQRVRLKPFGPHRHLRRRQPEPLARQHIDPRRADELRHRERVRIAIERIRRRDLLQPAAEDHRDPVRHRHRLDLVMRHVQERRAELAMELRDLGAHVHAQLGVEVAERLVHQEDTRPPHHGAGERHPLLLAARELRRLARQQALDLQHRRDRLHLGRDRLAHGARRQAEQAPHRRKLAHAKRHGDIFGHRQVRIERVGLEHHRDVARVRRQALHRRAIDRDAAGALGLEPGDDAQQCGFPAARGAQDGDELARPDVEVDAIEDNRLAKLLAEPGNAHGAPHGTRSGRIELHDGHSDLSLP